MSSLYAPPPSKFTPATLAGVTEEDQFPISMEESQKHLQKRFLTCWSNHFKIALPLSSFLFYNQGIISRLQQGPTCGLVSLRMAAEAMNHPNSEAPTATTLLEIARNTGATNKGEMFYADKMAELVELAYPSLTAECLDVEWDSLLAGRIIRGLWNGNMYLSPYDTAKNHEPCVNGGKTAHWGVLKGFIIPLVTGAQITLANCLPSTRIEDYGTQFYHLPPSQHQKNNDVSKLIFNETELETNVLFIAQQSKSKHQAIWSFTQLKSSNNGLSTFDPARIQEDPTLNVPSDLTSLRGKIVEVKSKPQ